ncbi:MAG: glycosyl hydrolase family 18 protein [Brumimicrobium sp.]
MRSLLKTTLFLIFSFNCFSQNNVTPKGIHQEQLEYYDSLGHSDEYYQINNEPATNVNHEKSSCQLEKYVFGWHPFWSNGLQVNYDWDLLSDMSYFSYELDPNTGNASTTHGFETAQAVTDALNNGVRVNLCVTLFNDHETFLGNATSEQTLISNLITLIQDRGAHGVNIDFESMSSTVSADFTNFMIDLCNQMHAAIPNSQVSIAMHAVDWSGFYDIPALVPYVDLFCIMGYDYYWQGSSTAGPNDPLYHFGSTYNYTLSKSTTYYLEEGVPEDKLILGLPYYGREWLVDGHTLPATTLANGIAAIYSTVKNNASGDYATANRNYEPESRSVYYNFYDGGDPYQCFISEADELAERMDFINKRDLAGMGIWALGYDDGYTELWDEIEDHFTNCITHPCSGEITDMGGGPHKNYYNNEDYTFTLSPDNAATIDVTFTEFDVEANYDYLYIYDGNDVNAPQLPGSPFSGTTLPSAFTSSSGDLTFRFTSDGSTVSSGFKADYICQSDNISPTTEIDSLTDWKTQDFTADFNDQDNSNGSGISKSYYAINHFDGNEWNANGNRGFLSDDFAGTTIHPQWTIEEGSWSENNYLEQTDETIGNTNIYAHLNQSLSNQYMYHWKGQLGGTGTDRRAGLHIFCDNPVLTNRGNSYFVWFRLDDDIVEFRKVENDNFGGPQVGESFNFDENVWYDFKLIYDRVSGEVWIYIDDELIAQWTDSNPHLTGDYISFRSGNSNYKVDSMRVYRSRYPSVTVNIGNNSTSDIQFQNPSPSTPSGKVYSITRDVANNLSLIDEEFVNIDWTTPDIDFINDGATTDEDTIYVVNVLQAPSNWNSNDLNSGVDEFEYAVGTVPYADDIEPWSSNGTNNSIMVTSNNFVANEWYHFSIKSKNGAGLIDSLSSDGFRLVPSASLDNETLFIPKVYPIPATERLNIMSEIPLQEFVIYDNLGREVDRFSGDNNFEKSIDVANYAKGNYIISIKDNQKTVEVKWVK